MNIDEVLDREGVAMVVVNGKVMVEVGSGHPNARNINGAYYVSERVYSRWLQQKQKENNNA